MTHHLSAVPGDGRTPRLQSPADVGKTRGTDRCRRLSAMANVLYLVGEAVNAVTVIAGDALRAALPPERAPLRSHRTHVRPRSRPAALTPT
jgi:hypothetical protein